MAELAASLPRILVVDDEDDITSVLATFLGISGYDVVVARDGQEGLTELRSGRPLPDLILLDLMMPGMNGWEFRAAQMADPLLARIPVVLLSGGGNVREHARHLGVNDALAKPADIDSLLAVIERHRCRGFDARAAQS
jgi:CheY-like chemotaxis protein